MESLFVLILYEFDVIIVYLSMCVTFFIVSSIMSPRLGSSSELE